MLFQIKKNIRQKVTKLEFPDDTEQQLTKISRLIYGNEVVFAGPAEDSSMWRTTDDYFNKAKASYDSVIKPFTKNPVVYKLEPVHQQKFSKFIDAPSTIATDEAPPRSDYDIDLELDTMIDPYALPKPWVLKFDRNDEPYYYNEVTEAKRVTHPEPVWKAKLSQLEVLTPREDLSGWEYRENEQDRRARLRKQIEFEKRLRVRELRVYFFILIFCLDDFMIYFGS